VTYDDFVGTFRPIANSFDKNASFDGYMFETYGQELDFVLDTAKHNSNRVWTIVEGDDGELYIVNGYHLVNRMGYIVTASLFNSSTNIEVLCD
jgi:primosomal protein N''